VSEEDIDVLISAEESVEVWEPEPLYIEAPAPLPPEFEEEVEEGGQVIIIDIAGEEE
tara:strand:+ start:116 stop:286 length:171 start_codon:yes stop_codon:yes gene_type:complete